MLFEQKLESVLQLISQRLHGLWDALVGMWHINVFSWYLGFSLMKWSYSYAKLEEPMDEKFYSSLLLFTNYVVKK